MPSSTTEYDAGGNLVRQVFNREDGGVHFTMTYGFKEAAVSEGEV